MLLLVDVCVDYIKYVKTMLIGLFNFRRQTTNVEKYINAKNRNREENLVE